MERLFKPKELNLEPNTPVAADVWQHWYETFENFVSVIDPTVDKLKLLKNHVSSSVYQIIYYDKTYDDAIESLKKAYMKPKNEIFARHLLLNCKQLNGQNIDSFMQKLRNLAKDCSFRPVTAEQQRDMYIREAFITGLNSHIIRQRLLEKITLNLSDAYEEARRLEYANSIAMEYSPLHENPCGATNSANSSREFSSPANEQVSGQELSAATSLKCFFLRQPKAYKNKMPC